MSKESSTWISDWNPEDAKFWESKGKFIARRNLAWSILAEHLGFSIWLVWSIVATKLPQAGFHFTTDQLFQLVALPGLVGSLIRFPYTFAVTTFGGRNWTVFSAMVLFIPTIALAYFVTQPDTPFWLMLVVAATAGLGGGNFASSMANISFFYPSRLLLHGEDTVLDVLGHVGEIWDGEAADGKCVSHDFGVLWLRVANWHNDAPGRDAAATAAAKRIGAAGKI